MKHVVVVVAGADGLKALVELAGFPDGKDGEGERGIPDGTRIWKGTSSAGGKQPLSGEHSLCLQQGCGPLAGFPHPRTPRPTPRHPHRQCGGSLSWAWSGHSC